MSTLPNVTPDEAGKEPSHAGLTSSVSPEVQKPTTGGELPYRGTSNFVPKEKRHWFVLRALYGHTNDAVDALRKENIEVYIPMRYDKIEISGKKRLRKVPFFPGLVFAYMTREKTYDFVRKPAKTARFLKYYTDKTQLIEHDTGHNPPITIPENKMNAFMKVVDTKNGHIMASSKEYCHFKSGDLFKVVCGEFEGVVGQVVRAAGQQRIAVELKGIGYVLTAYIPSDFLEKIEKNDRNDIVAHSLILLTE